MRFNLIRLIILRCSKRTEIKVCVGRRLFEMDASSLMGIKTDLFLNIFITMNVREAMNDVYEKINQYVYETRMIEIDEYLHGLNRRKIDMDKAYIMIINAPGSESNAVMNVWKGHFADPELPRYKSFWVEENESEANEFYRMAVDLNIERMVEDCDKYTQTCPMYRNGWGVDKNYSSA